MEMLPEHLIQHIKSFVPPDRTFKSPTAALVKTFKFIGTKDLVNWKWYLMFSDCLNQVKRASDEGWEVNESKAYREMERRQIMLHDKLSGVINYVRYHPSYGDFCLYDTCDDSEDENEDSVENCLLREAQLILDRS
jgi:hypothetical protein